jgi:DtxR family Mn-dependent transcriptional regulator
MSKELSASLEDYLEAIHHIVQAKGAARPKDIADRMGVNNSSVTGALKALAAKDLANYAPYDVVTLTPEGQVLAQDVIRRHEALKAFFEKVLRIESSVAEEGACKMEHEVPRPILERFIQFVEFVEICPRAGAQFIKGFGYHCNSGCKLDDCDRCVAGALDAVQDRRAELESGRRGQHTLDRAEPDTRARIVNISGDLPTQDRLAEMGLTKGSIVKIERVAPLGDPIEVTVRGYHLSLRASEAAHVEVEDL